MESLRLRLKTALDEKTGVNILFSLYSSSMEDEGVAKGNLWLNLETSERGAMNHAKMFGHHMVLSERMMHLNMGM
jgi:hypothetical protein